MMPLRSATVCSRPVRSRSISDSGRSSGSSARFIADLVNSSWGKSADGLGHRRSRSRPTLRERRFRIAIIPMLFEVGHQRAASPCFTPHSNQLSTDRAGQQDADAARQRDTGSRTTRPSGGWIQRSR